MPEQSIVWQNGDRTAMTFAGSRAERSAHGVGDTLPGVVRFDGLTKTVWPKILPVQAASPPAPWHLPAECG